MQNPQFGSKIKIPKKHVKIHSTTHLQLFCDKNRSKKTRNIQEMRAFWESAIMQRLSPIQNLNLSRNLKFKKTCQNPFYNSFRVVLCKKPLEKTPKYSRNESILKIGHHVKAIAEAKSQFGSELKIPKNVSKSILQLIYSCSVIKAARKNLKYSRNERSLKIGYHAKAIAHAKSLLWVKN